MTRTRLVPLALLAGCLVACGTTVEPSAQVATAQQQAGAGAAQGGLGGEGLSAGGVGPGTTSVGAGTTTGGLAGPQGTTGGTAAAGTGSTAGQAEVRGAQVGAGSSTTRTAEPLSAGFVVADFTKTAAAFGFGAVSDPQRYFKYLVAYYNGHGGLAGRKLAPVYSSVDGGSADWSTASQAVCSAMTEDNHVELVMSNLWVHPTMTACLNRAGVPQFEGTATISNDSKALRTFPNLVVAAGIATDREITTRITESVRLGWLTSKDKLGIVYDGCVHNARAAKDAGVPTATRLHIPVEAFEGSDCGVGFSDAGKFASSMQNAAFKMHGDGVNKVMFLTQGENGALVFFSNNAETQAWHPTYIVSSNAMMTSTDDQGQVNSGQRPNVRGIGWYPTFDDAKAPVTPQMRECQQHIAAGGGAVPTSVNDTLSMYSACNAVTAAAAALTRSGGAGRLAALRPAVESLGTSFVSVTSLKGRTLFRAGRHDGAAAVAPFALKKDCDCFGYVGPARDLS